MILQRIINRIKLYFHKDNVKDMFKYTDTLEPIPEINVKSITDVSHIFDTVPVINELPKIEK